MGTFFRKALSNIELKENDVSGLFDDEPFKDRPHGLSAGWVSDLLTGTLTRAPNPWELRAIAFLTGQLYHPFVRLTFKSLAFENPIPDDDDFRKVYEKASSIPDREDRLAQLIILYVEYRRIWFTQLMQLRQQINRDRMDEEMNP